MLYVEFGIKRIKFNKKFNKKKRHKVAIKFTVCGFPLSANAMPTTFTRRQFYNSRELEPTKLDGSLALINGRRRTSRRFNGEDSGRF